MLARSAQMEDRSNVWVTNACRCTCFAQKAKPRRFISEVFFADDFHCHGAMQVEVGCLVSDAHRAATQLDRFPIFALHQFIVLKSPRRQFWCRLDRMLGSRRLAGLNSASETHAEHAD